MTSLVITATVYLCRAWKDQGGHQGAGAHQERACLDPRFAHSLTMFMITASETPGTLFGNVVVLSLTGGSRFARGSWRPRRERGWRSWS